RPALGGGVHRKVDAAKQPRGAFRRGIEPGEALVELRDIKPQQRSDARQELRMRGRAVLNLLDCRLRDADLLAQIILRPAFGFARLSNLFPWLHRPHLEPRLLLCLYNFQIDSAISIITYRMKSPMSGRPARAGRVPGLAEWGATLWDENEFGMPTPCLTHS